MLDFKGIGPNWGVMVINRSERVFDGLSGHSCVFCGCDCVLYFCFVLPKMPDL